MAVTPAMRMAKQIVVVIFDDSERFAHVSERLQRPGVRQIVPVVVVVSLFLRLTSDMIWRQD